MSDAWERLRAAMEADSPGLFDRAAVRYFDRRGEPIDVVEWARLQAADDYLRVAQDTVGPAWVSTVWLGLDHNHLRIVAGGPPIVFETMIFNGPWSGSQWRWSTEAAALAGHERIVAALRNGDTPEGL